MHVVVQIHCALGNTFIIIKPSLNARQDCASWPHKADNIIVKIVSLIDSTEKTEDLIQTNVFVLCNPVQKQKKW